MKNKETKKKFIDKNLLCEETIVDTVMFTGKNFNEVVELIGEKNTSFDKYGFYVNTTVNGKVTLKKGDYIFIELGCITVKSKKIMPMFYVEFTPEVLKDKNKNSYARSIIYE